MIGCGEQAGQPWRNMTHDWASEVDLDHLEHVRRNPARFAPRGVGHLEACAGGNPSWNIGVDYRRLLARADERAGPWQSRQ